MFDKSMQGRVGNRRIIDSITTVRTDRLVIDETDIDRCSNSDSFRFLSATEGKGKTSWYRRLGLDVSLTGRLYDL